MVCPENWGVSKTSMMLLTYICEHGLLYDTKTHERILIEIRFFKFFLFYQEWSSFMVVICVIIVMAMSCSHTGIFLLWSFFSLFFIYLFIIIFLKHEYKNKRLKSSWIQRWMFIWPFGVFVCCSGKLVFSVNLRMQVVNGIVNGNAFNLKRKITFN